MCAEPSANRAQARILAEPWPAAASSLPTRAARARRPLGTAVALLLLAPAALAHAGEHTAALLVAGTAALAALVAVLPWPSPSRRVTLVAAAGAVAVASLSLDLGYAGPYRLPAFWLPFEWAALLVLAGRVARRARGRWAGAVGVAVVTAAAVVPLRFTARVPDGGRTGSVIAVLCSLVPLAVVVGASLYLRALDARRERAVTRARRAQRLEVARGLHDFVAHEVTGIVLEAQAGQLPGLDPEETAALLRRLEEAGLRALDSMDAMVGALRDPQDDGEGVGNGVGGRVGERGGEAGVGGAAGRTAGTTRVPGLAELPELVGRFAATGAVRARLEAAPETVGLLSAEADATAYTVVLEALTNVRRHAPGAAEVVVRVAAGPGGLRTVEVSVTDSGDGGRGVKGLLRRRPGSGGTGLVGLAERVSAHGGTLAAGPWRPTGWRTGCVLPARQADRSGAGGRSSAEDLPNGRWQRAVEGRSSSL
ncbi:sensor histidine kinase [Kitasatospora sp. NPDC058201]|uniref:sensor histidine kinase n=1 Tax=unclassified Kitasatospora TaxID=2633591 RepID=UPI0036605D68